MIAPQQPMPAHWSEQDVRLVLATVLPRLTRLSNAQLSQEWHIVMGLLARTARPTGPVPAAVAQFDPEAPMTDQAHEVMQRRWVQQGRVEDAYTALLRLLPHLLERHWQLQQRISQRRQMESQWSAAPPSTAAAAAAAAAAAPALPAGIVESSAQSTIMLAETGVFEESPVWRQRLAELLDTLSSIGINEGQGAALKGDGSQPPGLSQHKQEALRLVADAEQSERESDERCMREEMDVLHEEGRQLLLIANQVLPPNAMELPAQALTPSQQENRLVLQQRAQSLLSRMQEVAARQDRRQLEHEMISRARQQIEHDRELSSQQHHAMRHLMQHLSNASGSLAAAAGRAPESAGHSATSSPLMASPQALQGVVPTAVPAVQSAAVAGDAVVQVPTYAQQPIPLPAPSLLLQGQASPLPMVMSAGAPIGTHPHMSGGASPAVRQASSPHPFAVLPPDPLAHHPTAVKLQRVPDHAMAGAAAAAGGGALNANGAPHIAAVLGQQGMHHGAVSAPAVLGSLLPPFPVTQSADLRDKRPPPPPPVQLVFRDPSPPVRQLALGGRPEPSGEASAVKEETPPSGLHVGSFVCDGRYQLVQKLRTVCDVVLWRC